MTLQTERHIQKSGLFFTRDKCEVLQEQLRSSLANLTNVSD